MTNGVFSFVIFLYADGGIEWSAGDANTIAYAQAGFNAGDGMRSTTIQGSQTPDIVNITTISNIGVPGKFLYRVDTNTISATPPPGMKFDNISLTFIGLLMFAMCSNFPYHTTLSRN